MKIIFLIILTNLLLLVISSITTLTSPLLKKNIMLRNFPSEIDLLNYENELISTLTDVFQLLIKYTLIILTALLIIYTISMIKCKIGNTLSRLK